MTIRIIQWLRGRIADRIVQDVPVEIAVCEFNCRKAQCRQDEWTNCPRRLHGQEAAGL